jgi:hypothetical protein
MNKILTTMFIIIVFASAVNPVYGLIEKDEKKSFTNNNDENIFKPNASNVLFGGNFKAEIGFKDEKNPIASIYGNYNVFYKKFFIYGTFNLSKSRELIHFFGIISDNFFMFRSSDKNIINSLNIKGRFISFDKEENIKYGGWKGKIIDNETSTGWITAIF